MCLCVCLFRFFSKTDHRIFPKLGMKLKDNKGNKVTEQDFPKKIWIIQNFSKIWSKMSFFDFCRKSKSLTPTFLTENASTRCLWTPRENRISRKNLVLEILSCLQIIFLSKFHFLMILRQILGFRPFSWVYFADFAYYDRQAMIFSRYWWFCGWKKFSGPNLGHFRPKFGPKSGFWQIFRLRLIRFVWYCTFWLISMIFNY